MATTAEDRGLPGTLLDLAPRVATVRLPSLRYWRALHQEELSERHVSMATLWRLETGRPATIETARKLAEALELKPADLMAQPPAD